MEQLLEDGLELGLCRLTGKGHGRYYFTIPKSYIQKISSCSWHGGLACVHVTGMANMCVFWSYRRLHSWTNCLLVFYVVSRERQELEGSLEWIDGVQNEFRFVLT